jgi:D-arabinose 1-dehydrogenase-like Zn-dependent alcohol dehydrogenase
MKQAVMTSPGEILIHEIETPKPDAGEVLLKIHRC